MDEMDGGVVVMVDGRAKVLQKAGHFDHELLRRVLDHRPDLVLGPATSGDHPRLLLVARRATPTGTTEPGGPVLERVYVDSQGVPLLVGVQASADVPADGEVLMRLLDRVAVELPQWRGGWLRDQARVTHGNRDAAELLRVALGWRADPDAFWVRVESNLSRDRVRIVLVVDRLPDELTRVVEFLDWQLREVDVRAVEVSLYGSGQVCALVPRSTRAGSGSQRYRPVLEAEGRHRLSG
ncbi:MAG TPA: hypothetical protein VFI19_06965 [Nocardioides sp.]|nr:hypothetical protein [Nocardioides sp.]